MVGLRLGSSLLFQCFVLAEHAEAGRIRDRRRAEPRSQRTPGPGAVERHFANAAPAGHRSRASLARQSHASLELCEEPGTAEAWTVAARRTLRHLNHDNRGAKGMSPSCHASIAG